MPDVTAPSTKRRCAKKKITIIGTTIIVDMAMSMCHDATASPLPPVKVTRPTDSVRCSGACRKISGPMKSFHERWKAKMATLMKDLKEEGADPEKLARIHTPIGIPINSRTPEEIAVSIAAEIIAVKNTD